MNLIIVTCPQLVNDRLSKQISYLNSAIASGLITGVQIICMGDAEASLRSKALYQPNRWISDVKSGWAFFKENISAEILDAGISCDLLKPERFFPPRLLTKSEQSIALRHILAIKMIAESNIPCIVLEDDALVADQQLFHQLLHHLRHDYKNRAFFDLADNYIPINIQNRKTVNVGSLHFCVMPLAITRTLMAYAMSPETAQSLLESLSCYSLPIDMQIQVSLAKLLIPGLSLINSPLIHGSKGIMESSVLQH